MTPQFADWLFGTSDLKRGVLGHLVNGYDTRYLKQNLRGTPMARRTVRSDRKSWLFRGSKADIKQQTSPAEPVENDPGCVKTVTAGKCVKYNSLIRVSAGLIQCKVTPISRNWGELFYARNRLRGFHTAKTQSDRSLIEVVNGLTGVKAGGSSLRYL
jgi:hypothetical protein